MESLTDTLQSQSDVAVVIPCYRVEREITAVIRAMPSWVDRIIAVDDASPDGTYEILEKLGTEEPRLVILRNDENQGVGGATVAGFQEALRLGSSIIVKIDGDGQMEPALIGTLIEPLRDGIADYAKGNRFRHTAELGAMPVHRLIGSVVLTFLTKLASGCWHVFDVQNGFVAITSEALKQIDFRRIDRGYFFENSMLAEVNIRRFGVIDVPIPARYGDEQSSLRPHRIALTFPFKLARLFSRRVFYQYVVYDVSPVALYMFAGTVLWTFSLIFGGYHWWRSITSGATASAGTVVLALVPLLTGFHLFLQAFELDIQNSPRPKGNRSGR
jgi:glycosyltransferase involved in cell wall biosynthesis